MAEASALAVLEALVEGQGVRLEALERMVAQQQQQIEGLRSHQAAPPSQFPSRSASQLSESLEMLTTQGERKLRASEARFEPGMFIHGCGTPPPAGSSPSYRGSASSRDSPQESRGSTRPEPVLGTRGALGGVGRPRSEETQLRRPPEMQSLQNSESHLPVRRRPPLVESPECSRAEVSSSTAQGLLTKPATGVSLGCEASPLGNRTGLQSRAGNASASHRGGVGRANSSESVRLSASSLSSQGSSRQANTERGSCAGTGRPSSHESGRDSKPMARLRRSSREIPRLRADTRELHQVALLRMPNERPVTAVAVSEDGSGLVSAGFDGVLHLWVLGEECGGGLGTTLRSGQQWQRRLAQPTGAGEINDLSLLGSTLACGCQDGSVRIYRLHKEASVFALYSLLTLQHTAGVLPLKGSSPTTPLSEVMCVALSVSGGSRTAPVLASGGQDGAVCLWNSMSGQRIQTLEAHAPSANGWVMSLLLDRQADDQKGGLLLTGSYDHTVSVWSSSGEWSSQSAPLSHGCWERRHLLQGHTDGVLALALSRSRRLAYSASNDHTVRLWDVYQGSCTCVVRAHDSGVSAMGWHLASGFLATGAEDGMVRLWDTSAFESPEGKAGGEAGGAEVRCVHSLAVEGGDGTQSEVLTLAASADGTALFCGLDDGTVALLTSQ